MPISHDTWAEAQGGELKWWRHMIAGQFPGAPRAKVLEHTQWNTQQRLKQLGGGGQLRGKLLDLGCAIMSGFEGIDGLHVVAVEPLLESMVEAMPDISRLGQVDNVDYRCGTIQDIEDEDFDIVYCVNVLDHTADWRDIVANFARVLKPGGLLLLGADVRYSLKTLNQMHISAFTADELLEEVSSAGFAIEWHTPIPEDMRDTYYFCLRAMRNYA